MKNPLVIILLLSCSLQVTAQQMFITYGRVVSSFDYQDSQGNTLDNLVGTTNNTLSIGYRAPIGQKKWFLSTSISYNGYGAKGADNALDIFYEWDVDYLGIDIGVDYEFLKQLNFFANMDGLNLYMKGAVSTEFLVYGSQRINNQLYNLAGEEQFDKPVFFLRGGLGVNYCVSHRLAVFFEYMGGKSFPVFGKNSGDSEKLQYVTHSFRFGLLLSLPACKYCSRTF